MFENIKKLLKIFNKKEEKQMSNNSKNTAKERLHLVLMQDRANVSADFLELMKQEIIDVIKKYIDVDENAIDVRLTNKENEDGTNGAPALYANIPILNIKNETRKVEKGEGTVETKPETAKETVEIPLNSNEEKEEIKDNNVQNEETKKPSSDMVVEESKEESKEQDNQAKQKQQEEKQEKNEETKKADSKEEINSKN